MAVGAVLAFAVTARVAEFDIQTAGAIILFAGIGYLLVHLGLLGWERGWGSGGPPPPSRVEPYDRDRYDPTAYRRPSPPPRPPQRYAGRDDLDRTHILPVVRDEDGADDTTAFDLRRPPDDPRPR